MAGASATPIIDLTVEEKRSSPGRKEKNMTDDALQQLVSEELFWDPKVDSGAIAATAADGVVTLRGTVGSFREKREARKAAERVYGVTSVNNELEVDMLSYPEDDELPGAVLKAMALDGSIPDTINAGAFAGTVTLTGTVRWAWQRDEAEFVVRNGHSSLGRLISEVRQVREEHVGSGEG